MLSLSNVDFNYPGQTVFSELNLTVKKGDFIFVIGKSGSGKSTLLQLIYFNLLPFSGEVQFDRFNSKTIRANDLPKLRRKMGIIFQDFKLLPDRSVNENMMFVLKATGWTDKTEMQVKIDEVLDKVDMKSFASKMPHQLSGGEQQRVAIARALLNDPELILADEPTGNLDPQTSAEVLEVLRKINANGKTVIMATHDYALLMKFPSKTLKCEDNTIFEVVQRTV